MNLFYVLGGGMGHLMRVQHFIRQQKLSPFAILTNNPLASKLFDEADIRWLAGDTPSAIIQSLRHQLALPHEALYIDTFPQGMFGELSEMPHRAPLHYLARRLRWQQYLPLIKTPWSVNTTYMLEDLEPAHADFIRQHSEHLVPITLQYTPPQPEAIPVDHIPVGRPLWVVVHTFHVEEVDVLLRYAREAAEQEQVEPALVVITDQVLSDVPPNVTVHRHVPAADWYPLADRIFTGGGFNSLRQLVPYAHKTSALAFPRRYDDQGWRVRWFRELTAEPVVV